MVDDYDLAEDIVKQLNNGASFIKLAQQYSTDYLKPIPAQYDDVKRGIEISLINQRIDEKYPSYVDDLIDKANLMSNIDEYYENGYFDNYYYDEYYDYSDNIFSNPVLR